MSIGASYIFNGFFALVDALSRLHNGPGQVVLGEQQEAVVWMCEPTEAERRFTRRGENVRLDMLWFWDGRRSGFNQPGPALSVSGGYDEVCRPLWRALRHRQGRLPVAEFEGRRRSPFPTREMARLTQELGKTPAHLLMIV